MINKTVGHEPLRARRRFLFGIVIAAMLLGGSGMAASLFVKSPQQVAAQSAPPSPSVITAPVERRVLTGQVVLRGTVRPGKTVPVTGSAPDGMKAVLTAAPPKPGQQVKLGQRVAEVSGRPVIALHGPIPAYRDLKQGTKGPDVAQLQNSLRQLGYEVWDTDGTFGGTTAKALRKLYRALGYDVPTVTPDAAPPTNPSAAPSAASGSPTSASPTSASPTSASAAPQPYLPAREVAYVPRFPATVASVALALGDAATGTILTLSVDQLVVTGMLAAPDAKLVKVDAPVTILDEVRGVSAAGRVSAIGVYTTGNTGSDGNGQGGDEQDGGQQRDGQDGAGLPSGAGYPVTVIGKPPLGQDFAGQDVRVTIQTASTKDPVLVVPAAAIFANADAVNQVIVIDPRGGQRRVDVTAGLSAGGYEEVRPTRGSLQAGDQVMVGQQ